MTPLNLIGWLMLTVFVLAFIRGASSELKALAILFILAAVLVAWCLIAIALIAL